MSNEPKKIRQSGSYRRKDGENDITITGLQEDEFERMEGWVLGASWARINEARRLETLPRFKELPDPVDDPIITEYWPPLPEGGRVYQKLIAHDPEGLTDHNSPSLSIQHLCGYGYTPERYKEQAIVLERFGFACLRSKRLPDGRFYEIWYLSGLWCAKGELSNALDEAGFAQFGRHGKAAIEIAVRFLCRNASFGTLDVSVQRAAMTVD